MGNLISKSRFKRTRKLEITPEEEQGEEAVEEPEPDRTTAQNLSQVKHEASDELKKIMEEVRREREAEAENRKKLQKQGNVVEEPP